MATEGYTGSVDLISGIRPKNSGTFPLVDAHDVFVAAPDVRLDETLKGRRGITDLAVYDRPANWTSSSGIVARWDHDTFWFLPTVGGYLEYIGGAQWVLYDPSVGGYGGTYGITADENALSLKFSVPVDGGEPEEITFTRPSVYASSGDTLATKSYADSIAAGLRYALVDVELSYSVPDAWFPITFETNGTSYTIPLADKDTVSLSRGAGWYLTYTSGSGTFPVAWFTEDGVLGEVYVSSPQFNGVAPVVGETALDDSTATLADRAVNAVTVSSGMTRAALVLPPAVSGRVRDLIVRMTLSTDVAVTFTGPSGGTIAWDSSGDPSGTFAAGTHFLRLTEVAQDVFHVGGAASGDKLNSTSAAPAFDATATYDVGNYVTHDGTLYRCTTAVTTAGEWNAANWTAEDMTTPDATLDIAAGRLRLVDTDGTVLWQQGYDLAAESSASLSCDKVNLFVFAATTVPAFDDTATYNIGDRVVYDGTIYKCTTAVETAGAWTGAANWTEDPDTQAFALPTVPSGKVGDFILDIDNSANTVAATASLTGIDTEFSIVVPKGQSLAQMLTFAAGEMAELYFTQTAFKVNNLPTWKLVKQVVENGGAQA